MLPNTAVTARFTTTSYLCPAARVVTFSCFEQAKNYRLVVSDTERTSWMWRGGSATFRQPKGLWLSGKLFSGRETPRKIHKQRGTRRRGYESDAEVNKVFVLRHTRG